MSTTDAGPAGPAVDLSPVRPRRRHTARWAAAAVLALLVALAVLAATRPSNEASQIASPLVGKPAPRLAGTDFAGRRVSLAALRGRYVYVNFFASWCPPCQTEEQDLVAFDFQQQRSSHGAALVSVVFNDSDADALAFVQKWGAEWPTVPDSSGRIATSYGVASPPMTFLVDPQGVVVYAYAGPVTVTQLDQTLAAARAGRV